MELFTTATVDGEVYVLGIVRGEPVSLRVRSEGYNLAREFVQGFAEDIAEALNVAVRAAHGV